MLINPKPNNLPIGISTFKDIIDNHFIYVDKTPHAFQLINKEKGYYFLSRPRRFGKSLFLDTLKCIFEGKKELFEGLYIDDKWNWNQQYPVIKISFGVSNSITELIANIFSLIKQNQKKFDITLHNTEDYALCFEELIQVIHQKHQKQVVILIDEYDKPILDFLDKTTLAIEARDILKRLYHVIKDNDQYIKFAFLTGVSKFAKVSIFSGLNNLEDISLDADYATIAGYTQKDIESSFAEHLKDVDLQKLKQWYNGYNFLGEDIYNPFDILLFISKGGMYRNYWFGTGTPHFLIKLLQQKDYFIPQLENLVVDESIIDSFDIENLSIEPILYQSGYLTINEVIDDERRLKFSLKLPNKEVKISLNDLFIDYLTNQTLDKIKFQDNLYDALTKNDLESFKSTLITLFSSIPYNNYVNNNIAHFEGYYSSVIYAYLASLGITIIAEDITNKGRIDLTIQLDHAIYIIEFKVGNENALMQIIHKNYASKYLNDNKAIYLVGINFDSAERNITNFNYKQVKMTTRLV